MKSLLLIALAFFTHSVFAAEDVQQEIAMANQLLPKGEQVGTVDWQKWNREEGLYFTTTKGRTCLAWVTWANVAKCVERKVLAMNCAPYNKPGQKIFPNVAPIQRCPVPESPTTPGPNAPDWCASHPQAPMCSGGSDYCYGHPNEPVCSDSSWCTSHPHESPCG
ncbi:MAG: hypothetical protein ACXVB9_07780 [Bdellovibrionota bacterium]